MLIALTYMSASNHAFTPAELSTLLERSRTNNARVGLTGMLLYKSSNFMQVIEGESDAVETLYARIAADSRHRNVLRISSGAIRARSFATWSMGFQNLDITPPPAGFTGFMNSSSTSEAFGANPTQAQKLLMLFKESM